jgi:hypothetical protein
VGGVVQLLFQPRHALRQARAVPAAAAAARRAAPRAVRKRRPRRVVRRAVEQPRLERRRVPLGRGSGGLLLPDLGGQRRLLRLYAGDRVLDLRFEGRMGTSPLALETVPQANPHDATAGA